MTLRIGFIGIGIMGTGMVKNMRKAGVPVSFTARENERARKNAAMLAENGAVESGDYRALAEASDVIMLCLPDSKVVERLLLREDGIGPHLREPHIIVDHSTSYPASTKKLAKKFAEKGIPLLDAPLTGSRVQAEAGTLNVICGGPREVFDKVRPVFETISAHVFHVGGTGAGHAVKLINNFMGLTALAATCEAVSFAEKYGVNLPALLDAVSVSGGNSATFQGVMPRFLERDFGINFQQKFAHKDIRYFNNIARETGTPAPLAATLLAINDMALAKGYGDRDISSLLQFYEEFSKETP